MKLLVLLSFIDLIFHTSLTYIETLDPLYQIYKYPLKDQNFNSPNYICFQYGIWSKYNPLSVISQVGLVGLFDSNCYQFHNAVEQIPKTLIFIYYVCIDYRTMQITKTIEFSNDSNQQFKFEIPIDLFQLEDQWHYFGIAQWPDQNRCELIIFSGKTTLFYEVLQISYLYQSQDVMLTIGGGFIVNQTKIQSLQKGRKFSYFPGTIQIDFFEITNLNPGSDLEALAKEIFNYDYYSVNRCQENTEIQIKDQELVWLDQYFYTSENINYDSFTLSGWFKILKIVNEQEEFIYEFLRLCPNFENLRLSNQNFCPIQFYYKISSTKNQIIITSYSYTIPFIAIDLQNNPFLIQKSIDIENSLELWHKLYIKLLENKIVVNIKFWERHNIYEYNLQFDVIQFHRVQFKLTYGNNQQSSQNYLNVKVQNLVFLNCDTLFEQQNCHHSCLDCDGPNDNDCLSCSEESRRIYLSQQKACICPYSLVEDGICKSYQDYNLEWEEGVLNKDDCPYGYFEVNGNCIKCPSILRENQSTCLECLQNPKGWQDNPICVNNIFLGNQGNVRKKVQDTIISNFIFDGEDLKFCEICEEQAIQHLESIFQDYLNTQIKFKEFCQSNRDDFEIDFDNQICYNCEIWLCKTCIMSIKGYVCIKCHSYAQLKDGKCVVGEVLDSQNQIDQDKCVQPFYKNSMKQCQLCSIEHCIYCFEYLSDDLTKCTLYLNFEKFPIEENFKVGCALCEKDYIFNFIIGKCIYQKPLIENCTRSFIGYDNQEKCTLASNEDFSISPEIQNCQKFISNCLQCIMTPDSTIKCIICQIGYYSQIVSGKCKQHNIEKATIVIEGDFLLHDGFMQRIQSFMMQFLPNSYFYQMSWFAYRLSALAIECEDGYKLSPQFECSKYCTQECQSCQYSMTEFSFVCLQCPLDQRKTFIRSEDSGSCLLCSYLCEVCEYRSETELDNFKQSLVINDKTSKYSLKCLKAVADSNVVLDQYSQIPRLCFNQICNSALLFQHDFFNQLPLITIDQHINIDYCNEIGLTQLIIQLNQKEDYANTLQKDFELFIKTSLKSLIFSLTRIKFKLTRMDQYIFQANKSYLFQNFDEIEIFNMNFQLNNNGYFIFENEDSKINFNLTDIIFKDNTINNIQSVINTTVYGNIYLKNLLFQEVQFVNSTFLQLHQQYTFINITIETLTLQNCNLLNSNLFSILNTQVNVFIQNVNIYQCVLQNSTILMFLTTLPLISYIDLQGLNIKHSHFNYSYIFNGTNNINLKFQNIRFEYNILKNSTIFAYGYNLRMLQVKIFKNEFFDSKFSSIIISSENRITNFISDIEAIENQYTKAYLCQFISISLTNNLVLQIINIYLQNNVYLSTIDGQYPLFTIYCIELVIRKAQIQDQSNLKIFNIFDSLSITLEDIIYQNSIQQSKVPFAQNCASKKGLKNQLLSIQGFLQLNLINIMIVQQTSVDLSLINIALNRQYLANQLKEIKIFNLTFSSNLLLQQDESKFFSLLAIYSEAKINIQINNLQYYQNFLHQQTDDTLESSASLLFISCSACFTKINYFQSQNNGLTNSSNSFIQINSYFIEFNNFIIQNHNYLKQHLWEQFYDMKLDEQLSDEDIDHLIQQTFKIQNKGGVGSIISSEFYCFNCTFTNIRSLKSSIFDLRTQGDGIIYLNNIIIKSVATSIQLIADNSGCINIYSQNSKLNFQILNASFIQTINSMESSIISIIPSQKENYISLIDVQIINCLSFINQIMKVIFPISGQNSIYMKQIVIKQYEEDWIRFFEQYGIIVGFSEIKEIAGDENALIYLDRCNVTFLDVMVQGIFISSLVQIRNAQSTLFINCQFNDIQTFYSQNLIQLSYSSDQKSFVSFQNVNIEKVQQFNLNLFNTFIVLKHTYNIIRCEIIQSDKVVHKIEHPIINFINQIKKIQIGNSIIIIQSSSNQNSFIFNRFNICNIKCNTCQNGIFYVEGDSFYKFKIQDMNCNYNNFTYYGCLHFNMKTGENKQIKIIRSNFLYNKGSQGAGITARNISLNIQQCRFMNNIVQTYGGGLYLELNSSKFIIKQSFFQYNQAAIGGGGIYLAGDSNLCNENFIQSINQFNKADVYANNVVETPTHLALTIDSIEMLSQQLTINDTQKNILLLNPYKTIQQGRLLNTKYLMIPSNQEIKQYKLYIPQIQKFQVYLDSIFITWRNNQNELLQPDGKSKCEVIQNTFSNNQLVQNTTVNQILEYDIQKYNFDFGSLSFSFDPYQNGYNDKLQIQLNCKNSQYQKYLYYVLKLKTFKCQLGEFYIKEGCQLCQSNQGFYSVTYDAIKCSIFDKTKFQNITSNNIQLLNGFWRPHYLSDFTEYCFKNQKFCLGGWKTGNDLCFQGRIGGLCEECDHYNLRGNGYYFKDSENNCLNCSSVYSLIPSYIFLSIWALLSIILTLRSIDKTNTLFATLKIKQKVGKIIFTLNQGIINNFSIFLDHEGILIKGFLNYFWIFSIIFTFNIEFSFSFDFIDKTSNTSYFLANSLDCYLADLQQTQLIYTRIIVMPFLMAIQFAIIIIGIKSYSKMLKKQFNNSIISNTLLYLYVSNYAGLIKQLCSILSKRVISNQSYIQGDVSLQYGTINHKLGMLFFALPVLGIFSCLIPISLFLLMYIKRHKLDNINLRRHICYLFNEYDSSKYYWEQIKLTKKTIIILIVTQFETNIFLKASLLGLSLLIYQLLVLYNKPYAISRFNHLDLQSGQICSIAIFIAAAKYSSQQYNDTFSSPIFQIIIMLLCIKLGYPFIFNLLKIHFKKNKIRFINMLLQLSKKMGPNLLLSRYFDDLLSKWHLQDQRLKLNYSKLKSHLFSISKFQIQHSRNPYSSLYYQSTISSVRLQSTVNRNLISRDAA